MPWRFGIGYPYARRINFFLFLFRLRTEKGKHFSAWRSGIPYLNTIFNKIRKTANKIPKTSDKQVIELHKAMKLLHTECCFLKYIFRDETMKGDAYYAYRCL